MIGTCLPEKSTKAFVAGDMVLPHAGRQPALELAEQLAEPGCYVGANITACYVAAVLMLRLVARARDTVGNPGSIRNIEIAYKAFRNATNEGRERRSGRAFSPLRSTLARALAFISRSTSA